jgi:hypothetical protein
VPAGELRLVGVDQTLGDDAHEVGLDHGPVKRPPTAAKCKRSLPRRSWSHRRKVNFISKRMMTIPKSF